MNDDVYASDVIRRHLDATADTVGFRWAPIEHRLITAAVHFLLVVIAICLLLIAGLW